MKKSQLNRISAKRYQELTQGGKRLPVSTFKPKPQGRMRSKKVYVGDVLCDSEWEAEKYRELLMLEKAGLIEGLKDHLVITYKLFNEHGDSRQFQINIDFEYFDKELNRFVRCDRKSTKKLVKKVQPDWLLRFELLKLAEPEKDGKVIEYELEYMHK